MHDQPRSTNEAASEPADACEHPLKRLAPGRCKGGGDHGLWIVCRDCGRPVQGAVVEAALVYADKAREKQGRAIAEQRVDEPSVRPPVATPAAASARATRAAVCRHPPHRLVYGRGLDALHCGEVLQHAAHRTPYGAWECQEAEAAAIAGAAASTGGASTGAGVGPVVVLTNVSIRGWQLLKKKLWRDQS